MSTTQKLAVTNCFATIVGTTGLAIWLLLLTIYVCNRVNVATVPLTTTMPTCSVLKKTEHSRVIMFNMTVSGTSVSIPIMDGLNADTVEIISGACSGVIQSVNYTSGEIVYTASFVELQTVLDIFQYRALDNCSVWHVVTQSVCSQTVPVPPTIETACYPEIPEDASPSFTYTFPMLTTIMGTNPIDWSTFQFVTFDAYYEFSSFEAGPTICINSDEAQRAMLPWGTSDFEFSPPGSQINPAVAQPPALPASTAVLFSPAPFGPSGTAFTHTLQHIGGGVLTYTQTQSGAFSPPVSVALRIRVQVSDTMGIASNTATLYLFVTDAFDK